MSKYLLNKVDRLEQDIKGYQVTQDKENIRRANQMLGDHFHTAAISAMQPSTIRRAGTTVPLSPTHWSSC